MDVHSVIMWITKVYRWQFFCPSVWLFPNWPLLTDHSLSPKNLMWRHKKKLIFCDLYHHNLIPAGNHLFKVNRNTRKKCEICSSVFIVNFKHFTPCVSIVNFDKVNAGWDSKIIANGLGVMILPSWRTCLCILERYTLHIIMVNGANVTRISF